VEDAEGKTALIIAGGRPVKKSSLPRLASPDWIVAADSGLDQALRLGIRPDIVIGDMDSVTAAALNQADELGIPLERHPVDKDATDLELAIDAVAAKGYHKAQIIGGTGGRMAHTMANAMLLTRVRGMALEWVTSGARITALRQGESARFAESDGPLVSVLAVGAPARCVSSGLRWQLEAAPLQPGSTRGISNEIETSPAEVAVVEGQVLIIHETN
jgi:thiamine pyrophosphokinase